MFHVERSAAARPHGTREASARIAWGLKAAPLKKQVAGVTMCTSVPRGTLGSGFCGSYWSCFLVRDGTPSPIMSHVEHFGDTAPQQW